MVLPNESTFENASAITLGASYHLALRNHDPFQLWEGRRGTSKSVSQLIFIILRARQYPGTHWLLTRSTHTLLADSILRTLEEQVLPIMGIARPAASRFHVQEYPIGNGSFLIPRGLDVLTRSQSAEYSGAYLSEAVEIATQEEVESLQGSLREEGPPFHQLILDCNPWAPMHWLNQIAEPVDDSLRRVETYEDYRKLLQHNAAPTQLGFWKRIVTHWADNPGYWSLDPWGPTERGKRYIESNLGSLTGVMRDRWLHGLWTAAEGQVFPEFNHDVHIVGDFEPPAEWPVVLGYDPGWSTTAVLWIALAPDGGLFVFDEIYEGQRAVEGHVGEILARNSRFKRKVLRNFGDPFEMFSNRAQGDSVARQAMKYGLQFVPWPADQGQAFDAGVERVRHCLRNAIKERFPYVKVCARCKNLIGNFESWRFKMDRHGQMKQGADAYESASDHALDVLRGVISSQYLQRKYEQAERQSRLPESLYSPQLQGVT
jgi:hypothetical protein